QRAGNIWIWSRLFSPDEITQLHQGLNASRKALAELRRLPLTLVHGDFHIRNLGFDPHGNLVCIDWAHVGLAPLGSDIAVLASMYRACGGAGGQDAKELDREVVAAYAKEVEHLTGDRLLFTPISRAFALCQVTRGLHLRLGPGLSYLLWIGSSHDAEVDNAAAGVREGCKRALFYL
ncbi:MAG TPA: phosphotransferase, partial [Chloroflexota bacterium]|nr:phosphotransferase [Chloroflexota bacterium]